MRKVGMTLLVFIIIVFNFIIGANEKGLRVLPISILMALIMTYLIILKGKSKTVIFLKNKVDYLVLIFMITTILPLIFGTYASYSDTVEFILKYFFVYSVYILARNTIKSENDIECIISFTIICSCIPILFGLDYVHGEYLKGIMKWLNIIYNKRSEFDATFGYANTVAIYMLLCIFLALHKIQYHNKKIWKLCDIIYILFALYIIWITKSKWIMIMLASTVFLLGILKFRKQIIKHKFKILITVLFLLIIIIPVMIYLLNKSEVIVKVNEDFNEIIKYRFKENTTYQLELEIETDYSNDLDNGFELQILEGGKYFYEKQIANKSIGKTKGKIQIEFTTTKKSQYMRIIIVNRFHGTIKVSKCSLNGKNYILKYKYIPNELGYVFSGFLINGQSMKQREYIYIDCFKLAKNSPIIGNGGNAWKCMSKSVADYPYVIKETHSYFFELLISYGIIGTSAFLLLVVVFFVSVFKKCINDKEFKTKRILIAIGLLLLLLHSITFDFDMSFMIIQIIVYIYIAILLVNDQETIKFYGKYFDYAVLIFLIFILSVYVRASIASHILNSAEEKHRVTSYRKDYYLQKILDDVKNNKNAKEVLNELQDIIKKEPYYYQTDKYAAYFDVLRKNFDVLSKEDIQEYLDFGIKQLQSVKFVAPMQFDLVIDRAQFIATTIHNFKVYINKRLLQQQKDENYIQDNEKIEMIQKTLIDLRRIVNNEYKTNIKNIEDQERNGYSQEQVYLLEYKYISIMNTVNEVEK